MMACDKDSETGCRSRYHHMSQRKVEDMRVYMYMYVYELKMHIGQSGWSNTRSADRQAHTRMDY